MKVVRTLTRLKKSPVSNLAAALTLTRLPPSQVVFSGSAALPLLVDDNEPLSNQAGRLELVVAGVTTESDYERLANQLRRSGFSQHDTPTHWVGADTEFELFVTPYDRAGNFSRWHSSAFESRVIVDDNVSVVSVPYFAAIELERDTSLDPLLQLVAGRGDVVEQMRFAPEAVRAFVSARFRSYAYDTATLKVAIASALSEFRDPELYSDRIFKRVEAIAGLVDECEPASVLSALLAGASPPAAPTPVPEGAKTFPRSKTIRFADYDAGKSVMTIGFVEDRIYRYFAVPKRVYDALCESEHPGRYLNEAIRDRYPYEHLKT